ncbi:MAG: sigma-70 family RNA polymerase sigma factor [Chloroflexi bacterium]|nr:sigma-70 family RNA polymerase sigma factor [Chloroflexota bacterium]
MLQPPTSLERTIRKAQSGDEQAIASLYQGYAQKIYRYIAYRVPPEDAEDLTGEVFVKMVEGLPTYRITEVPFEAWLYRIAAARIADYYRRKKRRVEVELDEQTPEAEAQPEEQLLEQQEIEALREALQQLTPEQQSILILRFVERKSHEEVAAMLQRSVSAVKTIQHRALTHLAQALGTRKESRHYLRGSHD